MAKDQIIKDRPLLFLLSMAHSTVRSIILALLDFENMVEYFFLLG
jgi:hypothetical protein